MSYGHAPVVVKPAWRCPKCGPVHDSTVYPVQSPVDNLHNHRVLDTFGHDTGTRHTVTRDTTAGAA